MMKFFLTLFSVIALLSFTGIAEHIVASQPASSVQRGLARKVGGKKTRLQDQQRKQYRNQNPASRLASIKQEVTRRFPSIPRTCGS